MENVWWEVNPIHHNHKSCLQSRNQAKIEGLPGFGKKTPTKIGGLSAKSGRKEGETRGSTKEGAWWAGKGRKLGREAELTREGGGAEGYGGRRRGGTEQRREKERLDEGLLRCLASCRWPQTEVRDRRLRGFEI
ncbi:hypothetical protein ACFX15_046548 [Malus domestica]